MTNTPLNPDARDKCVDLLLELMGYPRDELFEYPNRADDSREYIARAERVLDEILVLSQPVLDSLDRKPWPHESCGCTPPDNALPPYWTCFKCDTTYTYSTFLGRSAWAVGV